MVLLPDRRIDAHAGRDRQPSAPGSYPGVELSLAEGEPEEIAPRLRAGEFDLALLYEFDEETLAAGGHAARVALLEDPMHVALPREHRLAGKAARCALQELAARSVGAVTSSSSPCARHVVRSCHAAGFEPRVAFESDDYQTVQGLVAAGVGVGLIPQLALSVVRDDIVIRALSPAPPGAPGDRRDARRRAARAGRAGDARHAPAEAADASLEDAGRARLRGPRPTSRGPPEALLTVVRSEDYGRAGLTRYASLTIFLAPCNRQRSRVDVTFASWSSDLFPGSSTFGLHISVNLADRAFLR